MRNKRADGRCFSHQDSNTGLCCVMNFVNFDFVRVSQGFQESKKGGGEVIASNMGEHSLAFRLFSHFTDCILLPAWMLSMCFSRMVVI